MCAAWGAGRNPDGDLFLRGLFLRGLFLCGLPLLCGAEWRATRFEVSSLQVVEVTTVAEVEYIVKLCWSVEGVACRGRKRRGEEAQ